MSRHNRYNLAGRLSRVSYRRLLTRIIGYTLIGEAIALPIWALFSPDVPCPMRTPQPEVVRVTAPAAPVTGDHRGTRIEFRVYEVTTSVGQNTEGTEQRSPAPQKVLRWIEVQR